MAGIQISRRLGNTGCAVAVMITGHDHLAIIAPDGIGDIIITGGDDDITDLVGKERPPADMLNHRVAEKREKDFARKPDRGHMRRDDGNDTGCRHWGNTPQSTLMHWPVMA